MLKIPTKNIPNQRFTVVLNKQNCTIHLYQRGDYLYMDLNVNRVEIRRGAICLPGISVPAYESPNFNGILFFVDMSGRNGIPNYSELNSRFILFYEEN